MAPWVYDALGYQVTTMMNERVEMGERKASFDVRGRGLCGGVHLYCLYCLTAKRHTEPGKMMLIRRMRQNLNHADKTFLMATYRARPKTHIAASQKDRKAKPGRVQAKS